VPSAKMHRVLITGAGGRIGRGLRETLRGVYPILRLSDLVPIALARDGEEVDQTDIAGMSSVERMVSWYDNSNAHRLGYRPEDDSEPQAAQVLSAEAGQPRNQIADKYQGGTFAAEEYDAATERE